MASINNPAFCDLHCFPSQEFVVIFYKYIVEDFWRCKEQLGDQVLS